MYSSSIVIIDNTETGTINIFTLRVEILPLGPGLHSRIVYQFSRESFTQLWKGSFQADRICLFSDCCKFFRSAERHSALRTLNF